MARGEWCLLKKLTQSMVFSEGILATRNVIILFGVFLLCVLWIGLFYKVQSERQLEIDAAFKETGRLARSFEEHTLRTIKGADQAALFLKYQYEKMGRNIDISQYRSEVQFVRQPFVLLSIIDEHGDLASSSQVPFVPSNVKDREHFFVHKDFDSRQLFVSKPVLGRSSGKWSIQMTRRVNKADGSFGGVVVVSVDPFYFGEFYKQVDLGGKSMVTLIGRDGIVRARGLDQNENIGRDVSNSPLMGYLKSSDAGHYIGTSTVDGIKRIYSYRALKEYPFVVLVGIDKQEAFGEFNQRLVSYYYIAAALTLMIITFIILLLVASEGQKRNSEALKQARDSLEVKVWERTQELFAANQELMAMNEEHIALNEELRHNNQEIQKEITYRKRIESILQSSQEELIQKNDELTIALETVKSTQNHLIQQEKLAGIGQLAAGVAHEINNPLGFITNNLETLEQYYTAFNSILAEYQELGSSITFADDRQISKKMNQILRLEEEHELDYILHDLPELFRDTNEGLNRMSKIVKGIGAFSRVDQEKVFTQYDLHKGLENTLLIARNEIKYNAVVEKILGEIPTVEAMGSEINQVLLNIIVNAVQAIKEKNGEKKGEIRILTWHDEQFVYCAIEDNGIGISSENLNHIFNPFFTTKPIGQGTGMGLSISYDIIVNRHHGEIEAESCSGVGTKFTIKLPIKHELIEKN
ncbi:MAG: sensor signal transduction histidine kinase [Firmicutes bacterium]|nr:sensor signal transduction histidine kinase [Bacillota bacterium]